MIIVYYLAIWRQIDYIDIFENVFSKVMSNHLSQG